MRLIDADALKAEIAETKQARVSGFGNSDYYTGYICALSVVEGMIAMLEKDGEQDDSF